MTTVLGCTGARAFVGSSGVEITTLGSGMTWNYMEFFAQDQRNKCNCGVLVLIALFRTVSLVSSDTPTNIITSRWYCAVTNGAYK